MKEKKDKWESLIRSKVYDFEVDTDPKDWDLIVAGLPEGKIVSFRPYRRYASIAAAAVAALLLIGGLYFYMNDEQPAADTRAMVEKPDSSTVTTPRMIAQAAAPAIEKPTITAATISGQEQKTHSETTVGRTPAKAESFTREVATIDVAKIPTPDLQLDEEALLAGYHRIDPANISFEADLLAVATPDLSVSKEVKQRRWGFGMGGGGFGVSSTSSGMNLRSGVVSIGDDEYEQQASDVLFLRSGTQDSQGLFDDDEGTVALTETDGVERSQGKVEHKMPLSAGMGVSYFLNDRWALQSGVVYTLLRSKGSYNNSLAHYVEWKQNLHYLGIPLSATYKIAEWNRLQLYATGGGMCEFNVSGKLKETVKDENLQTKRNERMKKPLWSVNARAGVDYPLWRFLYLYVEGGVSYYFDNKSSIETIRSDKPFNFSLQAGLRFGF